MARRSDNGWWRRLLWGMAAWLLCPVAVMAQSVTSEVWPQQAVLTYASSLGFPATVTFQRRPSQYTVAAQTTALLWSWRFVCAGTLQSDVLWMQSYQDVRQGRLYAQAVRRQNTLSFGKAGEAVQQTPLTGPVYDVFSLAWQLALQPQAIPSAAYLTNGKRVYVLPKSEVLGVRDVVVGKRRQSVREYRFTHGNNQVVYAISTGTPHLPVHIRYDDDGHIYVLELQSGLWDGQKVW